MAAATGDLRWETRYRTFEPQLDAAINEAIKLTLQVHGKKATVQTVANIALMEMENQAFDLVRQGRTDEALAILFSDKYETNKQIYAEGMTEFTTILKQATNDTLNANKLRSYLTIGSAIIVFAISFIAWIVVVRNINTWRKVLSMEIADRKEAQVGLKQYAKDLENSNNDLDDFAYIASHDLKEPLRGIANYAGFLIEDYQDKLDDDGRAKLETLQRLASRMETLIDSLLFYSRLGRTDLAYQNTDLNEVVQEVLESLHIVLTEKDVEIRKPMSLPTIRCDHVRMAEIYRNLISNAMKYNDKSEKWIEIGFRETQDSIGQQGDKAIGQPTAFYVRDNGIGIRDNHQDKIFTIFKRLHGRHKYGGGIGAGLTIVKKIVERHGGRIWVESTYGKGTTFFFTLENTGIYDEVTVADEVKIQNKLKRSSK